MPVETQNKDKLLLRYVKTACLTAGFCFLGLSIALLGPTLPTLAYNLGTEVKHLSYVLTAKGCGYLGGSLLCAFLFKKKNEYFLIALCLLFSGIGNFCIPLMTHTVLLAAATLITGFAMGILDTGGNVICLRLWGKKTEPWMQTLHFFFAFGATLSPFLAKPFIREVANTSDIATNLTMVSPEVNETSNMSKFSNSSAIDDEDSGFPRVAWSFTISALLLVLVSVTFFLLAFSKKTETENLQENTIELEGKIYRLKILCLLFIFYFIYVGNEVTCGMFIYTFAIRCDMRYSKHKGTLLNSLFWGTFGIGRFFAIFFSKCVSSKTLLILDLAGTAVSGVVLSFFPFYNDKAEWLMWASVALYGWSMASFFPTGITWAESYVTVDENAATVIVVGASLGQMVLPFIMAYFMARNPMNLMYFFAACAGFSILIFIILLRITSARGSRHKFTMKTDEDEHINMAHGKDCADRKRSL